MSSIGAPLDLEGFRRLAAEFLKAIPTCTSLEKLDAGFKCLVIARLDMKETCPSDGPLANSVYEYATRKFEARSAALIMKGLL
jgi:hypothetical protein